MKASADSKKSRRPERRELVEHQQQPVPPALGVQLLGQAPADLVEDQAHQRLGAADVGGRHDEVERGRPLVLDQVADAPVAPARDLARRPDRGRARGSDMAVESTPERSFSLLFRSSRAAEATTGCAPAVAEMRRRHHRVQRRLDRPLRVGEEVGDAGERLVRLGVEHMQDRADQERMAGLLPMIAPLERAFGIDQDVGDVLDVAHLAFAAADLEQRIVGGDSRVGRIEQQHAAEPRAPAGGQLPVLALDVVDDGASPARSAASG